MVQEMELIRVVHTRFANQDIFMRFRGGGPGHKSIWAALETFRAAQFPRQGLNKRLSCRLVPRVHEIVDIEETAITDGIDTSVLKSAHKPPNIILGTGFQNFCSPITFACKTFTSASCVVRIVTNSDTECLAHF